MYKRNSFLIHYGISGQKWGVRRFQNDDGTLTEEGKQRYYDDFTVNQKKQFNRMSEGNQRNFLKKIAKGKSYTAALKELRKENEIKGRLLAAGFIAGTLFIHPATRPMMVSAVKHIAKNGKRLVKAVKNSKLSKIGSMYLDKIRQRKQILKNGGVVLKKSQYSVKEYVPKFGGYLK